MQILAEIIRPESFDIFGLFVFSFLIISAWWGLSTRKALPQWVLVIILTIGILGVIVDGSIVFVTYFI